MSDEAQKWLVVFAREIAGIVGASVTPIDLDAIREAVQAEIDRLRVENATERKRAEFWRGETAERVDLLQRIEAVPLDADGAAFCPDCGQPKGHWDECDLARLMNMPEEPKP